MKVSSENILAEPEDASSLSLRLPHGLVGFPGAAQFSLTYDVSQLPFRWLQLEGPLSLQFVVIEPGGIVPDYEIELFDEDAQFLGIQDSADAIVLNIVTVGRSTPATATVNLVGPIVINRHTGLAKQVVLANHSRYSVRYPLVVAG